MVNFKMRLLPKIALVQRYKDKNKIMFPARLILILMLFLSPSMVMAEARMVINQLKVSGNADRYKVNAQVDYRLNRDIKTALSHGIKVRLNFHVTLGRYRSWWWNSTRKISKLSYQVKYHALSKRYILVKMEKGNETRHWNFSSLPLLLRQAGRIVEHSLPKMGASVEDGSHFLYFRATAHAEALRLPLRIQTYLKNGKYYQESEGVAWPLG